MMDSTPLEQRLAAVSVSKAPTLRLDTVVAASSRYRRMIYIAIAICLGLLAYLANFNYWQFGLLMVSAILAIAAAWLTKLPLVRLTQPALTRSVYQDWLLMMSTTRGEALWRADLLSVQEYGVVIVLKFAVAHPQRRMISRAIFRDQVTPQAWHQLKVLAQLVK